MARKSALNARLSSIWYVATLVSPCSEFTTNIISAKVYVSHT